MEILHNIYDSDLFSYLFLPLLIFFARISDVTIGTLRIVMVSKGQKLVAPLLGFFEVFIWLVTMSKVMQNVDNWWNYVAYAAGFGAGNYIGLRLEEKLAMGIVQIQIITRKTAEDLIAKLRASGFGVTSHDAQGGTEKVSIIYTIVKRTDLPQVIEWIKIYNPNAFYSIEDVKFVNKGVFPQVKPSRWRKGK
ncbi:DUF2179 domain-containing protein [Puteibacter caeruleilacunae]|nr:DUF2179 domain-containing protein [Puteibacter caeruleilacunae]